MKCVLDLRPRAFIVIGAVLFLFAVPSEASDTGGSRLTLEACLRQALSGNRQLQAARFAAEKATWGPPERVGRSSRRGSASTRRSTPDRRTGRWRSATFSPVLSTRDPPYRKWRSGPRTIRRSRRHVPIFDAELIHGVGRRDHRDRPRPKRTREAIRDRILLQVTSGYLEVLKRGAMLKLQREFLVLTGPERGEGPKDAPRGQIFEAGPAAMAGGNTSSRRAAWPRGESAVAGCDGFACAGYSTSARCTPMRWSTGSRTGSRRR